jgi:hypothetical protein
MDHHTEADIELLATFGLPAPYYPPRPVWHEAPDQSKSLILSDPHEPWANQWIYSIVEEKERDAGRVIIPGDFGDWYSKSRFRKEKHHSFKDEAKAVFLRMEWLATRWPDVRIMIGNHDNRPEKLIKDLMAAHPDLLIMTEQNLIKRFANFFPNVEIVGYQLDSGSINLTHIYQFGDIIFTHGELSRVQQTATLEYISRYLHDWKEILGLQPYKVIAQAHNHRDLKRKQGGEYHFMLPTLADPYSLGMEYIYGSRMIGRPPSLGYTIFHQEDGITDYNRSHNYVWDHNALRHLASRKAEGGRS